MWIGVLSIGSALAVGHLVAAATGPNSSPYLAVGNTAVDLTPEPVKAFAIREFGAADKTVLLAGMAVVLLALGVLAGLVSRRRALPGLLLVGGLGVVGIAAAAARPDLGALGVLPAVAAAAVGLGVFAWLHRLATAPPAEAAPPTEATPPAPGRRRFLVTAGSVAVVAGAAAAIGQRLSATRGAERSRAALGRIAPAEPAPPVPAGADFAASGTPTFITPNRDFYRVDTALMVPQIEAGDWRLRVHGMVDRELELSFADLTGRRLVERTITLCCVSNDVGGPYISTADFVGVPIREVLAEAGVRPGAQQVLSTSVDGFTAGTPIDVLTDPKRDALLAVAMNGEPLPVEHGFPVRMVTPGLYGYVSATKWLTDLEVTTFDRQAYWVQRGWAQRAPVKTQSRIDRPAAFGKVPAGRVVAAGIAWAQHTGVDRVEVRMDGGPWQVAQLSTEVSTDTWRMWRIELDAPPGGHTLECRATDRSGYTQTGQRTPPEPDGATGWHSVFFTTQ
ncbi:molybdopterin-binding protein [Gandjariella thermophila]|uniref:Molybdopterin-binding protein n=1 Tax=Gandjariella thermophila TaxID=1931992 RepID=A0A4D4JG50_9PSEU|nr:molybdopterin-binding protein [Gandjariella thermophila]